MRWDAVVFVLLLPVVAAQAQTNCTGVSTSNNTALESVVAVDSLTQRPLFITSPSSDTDRIFVVEQNGYVRLHKRGVVATTWTTFLDIHARINASGNEMGLLGMAFAPDYATTGYFFVDYTESRSACPSGIGTVVSRFKVSANPDVADSTSELRELAFCQPENNHNGGWVAFGPDGYLYIATGDGGGGGDLHGTCGNGQSRATLLGKLLRIDVRGLPNTHAADCGGSASPYKVPNDNPINDGAGGNCDELWSWGLRNPWRNSFDASTGEMYIGDVGQGCWEEIDYAANAASKGKNYGWRQMEGKHCFDPNNQSNCNPAPVACGSVPACNSPSLTQPVLEVGHSNGVCAIIGGYAYRGCKMPNFRGTYFYGDECAGFVRSFVISGGTLTNPQDWTSQLDPSATLPNHLTSFGTDARGELYLANNAGKVLLVTPVFTSLEVSAPGAQNELLIAKNGTFTWEDLFYWSGHPVSLYRVYRGVPNGVFTCVFKTSGTTWTGDAAKPAAGAQFAYLVTAVTSDNRETSPGTGTPGTPPRQLSPATCP